MKTNATTTRSQLNRLSHFICFGLVSLLGGVPANLSGARLEWGDANVTWVLDGPIEEYYFRGMVLYCKLRPGPYTLIDQITTVREEKAPGSHSSHASTVGSAIWLFGRSPIVIQSAFVDARTQAIYQDGAGNYRHDPPIPKPDWQERIDFPGPTNSLAIAASPRSAQVTGSYGPYPPPPQGSGCSGSGWANASASASILATSNSLALSADARPSASANVSGSVCDYVSTSGSGDAGAVVFFELLEDTTVVLTTAIVVRGPSAPPGSGTTNSPPAGSAEWYPRPPDGLLDGTNSCQPLPSCVWSNATSGDWFVPRTLGPRFRLATRLGARFTGISNFASDAQFEVVVAGQSQGIFTNGQALSFSGFPGGGVPEFVLFPVGPAQPNTYPIQLTFDSPTAAFEAHPASPLRVLPLLRRLGPGSGISMDATNMLADGETAQLEAVVTGACTNTYQWRRDGVPLPGATNSTLAVSNFTRLQAGQYSVAVSNGSDVAESPPMRLAPLQYWLTITAPNGGVLRSPDLPLYDPGTAVTVTAVPAPGMAFSRWLGAITNPSNPLVVTMNSNVSLTAFFVPALAEPVALGGLKAEYFTNLAGGALADLTNSPFFPSSPDLVEVATQFESRTNWADSYGARLSGWLIPPTTGDYKFYLSSDDQGVLFLSTDASPEHKAPIAFEPAWSGYREYINSQNQATRSNPPVNISTNIPLVAGRAYYLESLVKEGVGGDHLSVSWQPPGGPAVTNGAAPIPGQYLASGTPYVGSFQPLRAASLTNSGQIGVSFGRLLDPESALQTTNYQVGGATVTGAALSPDRQGVLLNVSGLSGATFVLRAGAVRDLFGNSTPANTELTGAVLPQYRQDIGTPGDPAVAGTTFSSRAGEFDVVAGGSDIWNNADGFHFVYEQRTGDFDVQVRVESLEPVNRWSKAGLMVREALTAGSRHLTALVAPAGPTRDGQGGGAGLNAYEALFRPASGEATMTWNQPGADLSLPAYPQAWIRLQRTGNDFRAFRSADGWNWTLIGQTNQNYPATVHVGLATCSHNNNPGFTALARYRNYGDSGPAMPVILTQPTNVVVVLGAPAALSVTVSAPPPLGYQWWFRGAPVLGGTNAVLTFPSAQFADAGGYQVVATTTIGSVTSVVATLKVVHPIPGLFGTGVAEDGTLLSEGATDPHYRLVVSPDGSYPGPAAVVVNEAWPIAPAGPWLANGPASKWIAPRREQNTGNAQGAYTYRTTFALQDLNPFGARLTGQWAVDDGGVAVRLNGTATGLTNGSGFGSFVGFAITNGFVAGTNTLDFVVENGPSSPNPTGLRVELLGWVEANDIHVPLRFALRPGTGIGSLNLVLASTVGGLCRIETSTNLVNWMPWPTNLLFGAGETSVPLPTANAPSGFYRAAVYP